MDLTPHAWECENCGNSGYVSRTESLLDLTCGECDAPVAPMSFLDFVPFIGDEKQYFDNAHQL